MAQKHSHVPKIGNWDKDNILYTTYFENARKEKAGKHNIEGYVGHNPQRRQRSIRSESGNKSHSDYSHLKPGHRPLKSDQKKSPSRGSNSFYPSRHHGTAFVPKFGAWDEADPKSGERFTVKFNKVKEEKQLFPTRFPTVNSQAISLADGQSNDTAASPSKSKGRAEVPVETGDLMFRFRFLPITDSFRTK
ncbi:RPM1-interacting protein 4-like [Mangifera indica]|uniref:RPM1-interacting protein 4-like n=1 Tax=Mangifera indica TaxID=29780 RepID=UPI001CFB4200|nr:RPM1-interacting protein 4-like [Mangifera indica]